ncbi:MAG: GTPase HflX [Verrucomicrobia bacterium]|nr:MAG: GTPase HflX [Verrucomicrobiota bacterium]
MSHSFSRLQEKAILVALEHGKATRWDTQESLEELHQLAATAGAVIADIQIQRLEKPTAPYYIGKGKAEELARECKAKNVTSVIFDDELSPAQGRNLEAITHCKVLDRTQLILDIFAQRARTREGRLQIELAQLQYLLPRLTRMWTHLSRQTGGIGTRGPGETQLEVDRRRVQERIAKLEKDLESVRKNRSVQREGRLRRNWPIAAVVGYTNAGKSSLLNRLTGAEVLAENKLFATLDPTTRQLTLPNRQKILLTDTVGFIRKLPHTVVESFKATLEEVQLADLLIHIIDISHPNYRDQMAVVDSIVKELGAHGKQTVLVFNKIDQIENRELVQSQLRNYPNSVAISVHSGEGMNSFLEQLEMDLSAWRLKGEYQIPLTESALIAELHRVGRILSVCYEEEYARISAHIPPHLQSRMAPFEVVVACHKSADEHS